MKVWGGVCDTSAKPVRNDTVTDMSARWTLGIEASGTSHTVPVPVEKIDLGGTPGKQSERSADEETAGRTFHANVTLSGVRESRNKLPFILALDVRPDRDIALDCRSFGQVPADAKGKNVSQETAPDAGTFDLTLADGAHGQVFILAPDRDSAVADGVGYVSGGIESRRKGISLDTFEEGSHAALGEELKAVV